MRFLLLVVTLCFAWRNAAWSQVDTLNTQAKRLDDEFEYLVREAQSSPSFRFEDYELPFTCSNDCHPYPGDFNGDGLADLLVLDRKSKQLAITWGRSDTQPIFFQQVLNGDIELGANGTASDFDGDGRYELLIPSIEKPHIAYLISIHKGANSFIETHGINTRGGTYGASLNGYNQPATLFEHSLASPKEIKRYALDSTRAFWRHIDSVNFGDVEIGSTQFVPSMFYFLQTGISASLTGERLFQFSQVSGDFPVGSAHMYWFPLRVRATLLALGDFNGDGYMETLTRSAKGVRWEFIVSSDRGGFPIGAPHFPQSAYGFTAFDINNDGLDDIITLSSENPTQIQIHFAQPGPTRSAGIAKGWKNFERELLSNPPQQAHAALYRGFRELVPQITGMYIHQTRYAYRGSKPIVYFVAHSMNSKNGSYLAPGGALSHRAPGPFVCTAYNGGLARSGPTRRCLPNHYIAGFDDEPQSKSGQYPQTFAICCPLPVDDVLDAKASLLAAQTNCPPNSIAVGIEPYGSADPDKPQSVTCAPINTSRYTLSSEQSGTYWGLGHGGNKQAAFTDVRGIPAALRFALRRRNETSMDLDGCMGPKAGTMLTSLPRTASCGSAGYRELYEITPHGKRPVKMLPECSSLPDLVQFSQGCSVVKPDAQ